LWNRGSKPTYNRISKENVIENATSHDHVGISAQDVAGAEIVAQVLIAAFVPKEPIKLCNLILGIPVGPYSEAAEPMMLEHFYHTAATLEAAGCTIKRIHAMPNFDEICKLHVTVNLREFATYHANFSCFHHLYSPKTRQLLEEGKAISDQELETAQKCKAETQKPSNATHG
jgi:aspartyl-tRNA(Asn)/glutamyl-tRNA(Gln) amidotransferase subunit A